LQKVKELRGTNKKMSYKTITGLIPVVQAATLVNENIKATKKKSKTKDIVGLGLKNIVGINVIKLESDLIAGL